MIVLHYPYANANQLKMVMKDGQFVLPNNELPTEENMKEFLEEHSDRSEELKECIKKHKKKGIIKTIVQKEININLMVIYEKILYSCAQHNTTLAVSEELQGKFRKLAIFTNKTRELHDKNNS
jgi:hypothetical protein